MRETQMEEYLTSQVRAQGGMALKFVSPGCTGVPDRIVILPEGLIGFLELKAPGEKPRKDQLHRMSQLKQLGCIVGWADSREKVDGFLLELQSQRDANDLLVDILEAGGLI